MNLRNYIRFTPSYKRIINLFNQDLIKVDHCAVRSFNPLKTHQILTNFKIQPDIYEFPKHHAKARWYLNLDQKIPRVFASSYQNSFYDKSGIDPVLIQYLIDNPNKITYQEYQSIHEKNPYLAWTLLFRNKINHVAFEVKDIQEFTEKVSKEFLLNNSDNPIQISEDKKILQSSIKADMMKYKFYDKEERVPFAFVEFIERHREGFETQNANEIFKSTN